MRGDVFCWDRIISSGSGRDAELCTLEGPWFWWFSERFLLVLTTIPDTPPWAVANIMTPSIVVLHHWRRDCSAVSPSHEISTFGDGDRILTLLHIYIYKQYIIINDTGCHLLHAMQDIPGPWKSWDFSSLNPELFGHATCIGGRYLFLAPHPWRDSLRFPQFHQPRNAWKGGVPMTNIWICSRSLLCFPNGIQITPFVSMWVGYLECWWILFVFSEADQSVNPRIASTWLNQRLLKLCKPSSRV